MPYLASIVVLFSSLCSAPAPSIQFAKTSPEELISGEPHAFAIRPEDRADGEEVPSVCHEYRVGSSGKLFVYALSEKADLALRVHRSSGVPAEDDDSGGGQTPCLRLEVAMGDLLSVAVRAADIEVPTEVTIHLLECGETPESLSEAGFAGEAHEAAKVSAAEGDHESAREILVAALDRVLERSELERSPGIIEFLWNAGALCRDLGDLETAVRAWKRVLVFRERALPDTHPDLQELRGDLGLVLRNLGLLDEARKLQVKAIEVFERTHDENSVELQKARMNLAATLYIEGEYEQARLTFEVGIEKLQAVLSDDHFDVQVARMGLAATLEALGELHLAREMHETVLRALSTQVPEDHPHYLAERLNLAACLNRLGELEEARQIQEDVIEAFTRTLPEGHPNLLLARSQLAVTLKQLGFNRAARVLEEQVLEGLSRMLPPNHPDLQGARMNLAATLNALGEVAEARWILEQVCDALSTMLPDDHLYLQQARQSLAVTLARMGDLAAAQRLEEQVLAVFSEVLPPTHPDLLLTRLNYSMTLFDLQRYEEARRFQEKVVEVRTDTLPANHIDLQRARAALALTLYRAGELNDSRELIERVLEVQEQSLPADHPDLHTRRGNLASVLRALGRLEEAREIQDRALKAMLEYLPDGHVDVQTGRSNLLITLVRLGDREGARSVLEDMVAGTKAGLIRLEGQLSPRELEAWARQADPFISQVLSLASMHPSAAFEAEAFSLVETARASAAASMRIGRLVSDAATDGEAAKLIETVSNASAEVSRLSQQGGRPRELYAAIRSKDTAQRTFRAYVTSNYELPVPLSDPEAIAATLAPGEAAIGYWRYDRSQLVQESEQTATEIKVYFAYVLRNGQPLRRVELGPAETIEMAVSNWRVSIGCLDGADRSGQRGVPAGEAASGKTIAQCGEELRRLLFDPLRPAIGDAKRLIIACDGAAHLVPFDALPDGEGVLGDRLGVTVRTTLKELTARDSGNEPGTLFLALGAVDFDGTPEPFDAAEVEMANAARSAAPILRGAPAYAVEGENGGARFAALPATESEIDVIVDCFKRSPSMEEPVVLKRRQASREALQLLAGEARYLHIATHGYFAPETVPSMRDEQMIDEEMMFLATTELREQVRGMAPLVLCGLALAGANADPDAQGRVPGILTGEDLADLDLSRCELAVLSACETGVGDRRMGQGVASLHQALYVAGVRTSLTSLWVVPDEPTSTLMRGFYRRLWSEGKPKAQALWESKQELRQAKDASGEPRYELRDWAGWVLAGDPN